jgi:hypothetical protein
VCAFLLIRLITNSYGMLLPVGFFKKGRKRAKADINCRGEIRMKDELGMHERGVGGMKAGARFPTTLATRSMEPIHSCPPSTPSSQTL